MTKARTLASFDATNINPANLDDTGTIPSALLAGVGGGIYEQVSNLAISDGDAYLDVQDVFNSTYKNYLVSLQNITVNTNSADLQCLVMNADSTSPSEHTYQAVGDFYNDAENRWGGSNSSNITIIQGQGQGAGKHVSGYINFFDMNNSTDGIQRYTWNVSGRKHDSNNGYVVGGGNIATNTARTGFKIKCNTGTLGGGRVVVYGIKNPT